MGQRTGANADAWRGWCKQAVIDSGETLGTTTTDVRRIRDLDHELKS